MSQETTQEHNDQAAGQEREHRQPFDIGFKSVSSPDHPLTNQDTIFVIPEQGAGGIFDGLGKSAAPERASTAAREFVQGEMADLPQDSDITPEELSQRMQRILLEANDSVRETGGRATAVIDKLWQGPNGERQAIVVGGGHCRAYLYVDGSLKHLTLDDTLRVPELRKETAYRVQESFSNAQHEEDIPEEFRQYDKQYRNKVRFALGDPTELIEPRIQRTIVDFPQGAVLLTMSDGIPKSVRDERITAVLQTPGITNQMAADQVVAGALRAPDALHAKRDDITIKLVSVR
jgi:serine/threonine protein phosphatase PrpC